MTTTQPSWTPHYHLLHTRLQALRYIFPGGAGGETCCAIFDEFLEHREFGLALDILCDFLLEPDIAPPTEAEFNAITQLHVLMGRYDDTVLRLRDKRENCRSAES